MPKRTWLVTGGAGFIGANTVSRLGELGDRAIILDNLSRATARLNLDWLEDKASVELVRADVRDAAAVDRVFAEHGPFDSVLHLAGQVAVTTSVQAPRDDLETNVVGSFNVLDATRRLSPEAVFLNASTNKVYGQLSHHIIDEAETRYVDRDAPAGISESEPLDPCSPYGCSKCAADTYTLDYARVYGMRTVSLRQSCIYGPRQFGIEDQGWVAWFAMAIRLGKPLTIFGTGKQVRDLLHVDDLVDMYLRLVDNPEVCDGRAYNVGGGPENAVSLLELLTRLAGWRATPAIRHSEARAGDQLVFVADTAKARVEVGWVPRISFEDGLGDLLAFVDEHAPGTAALLDHA
jgi:CDP-paratose 2-epimerase